MNDTVNNLLERFTIFRNSYKTRELILLELFEHFQTLINTIVNHEENQILTFKILDVVLDDYRMDFSYRPFNKYFIHYLHSRLDLFLKIAQSGKHSADSTLWKIIGYIGMFAHI